MKVLRDDGFEIGTWGFPTPERAAREAVADLVGPYDIQINVSDYPDLILVADDGSRFHISIR